MIYHSVKIIVILLSHTKIKAKESLFFTTFLGFFITTLHSYNAERELATKSLARGHAPNKQTKKYAEEHKCSSAIIFAICSAYCLRDYSTIVATRPEPTVRPPSRSRFWICHYLLPCFLLILCCFQALHTLCIFISQNYWSHFGAI